jgi:NMD protein affecting ribosome stability and mRNA decay
MDFIQFKDKNNIKIGKIIDLNQKKIIAIEIGTDQHFDINWKDMNKIELLKTKEETKKAIITSKSPKNIQILNPETYETVDFPIKEKYKNYSIGEEIETIFLNKKLYII